MGRFKPTLEIRKCLYKLSHIPSRNSIDVVTGAQVPNDACKKALGGAHRLEREMRDIVANARNKATDLVTQECAQIDIPQNKLNALNRVIKAFTLSCEETHALARLVVGEHNKATEEHECNEDENKCCHG